MKKLYNLSMLAIAAIAAFSCTIAVEEDIQNPEELTPSVENPLVITAYADDDIAPDTKTSLSGVSILWSTTDAIAGYEGSTKHVSTGTATSDGGKMARFTFSGVTVDTNLDYLIYPAAAAGDKESSYYHITLPTEQTATANSFADGANVSLAAGKVDDEAVLFKNLGALIGIQINNDNIESVKVSANEEMTGDGIVDPSDYSAAEDGGETYVKLTGGLTNGTPYYAVVYPSPVSGYTGLLIVAENIVGQTATYSNSNPLVLSRNDNKRIANLTIAPAKWTPSYESWTYSFGAKQFEANETVTLNGKDWELDGTYTTDGYWGYDGTKGQQFGKKDDAYSALTLTSNFGVSAGIRAVSVSASCAKDVVATMSVSVGGVDYKCSGETSIDLTETNTAYNFVSPTGKVKTGDIVISMSQPSTVKALYIKTITINGKESPALSFSTGSYSFPNGSSDYLAFTGQAVTNPNSVPIASYESSDTSIATVDSDGNVTLKGKVGSTTITATSEETFTFASSSASYTITVTATPKVYVKASSVTSGNSYLIIAKYGAGFYMANPVPGNKDYAYLGQTVVTEAIDGSITLLGAEDNLFTFTTSGLGYSIQQSDNRYMYQTGSNKTINVNSSAPGDVWSVTKQPSGEFKLQYGEYWMQYSSGYTSYGVYNSTQANSALPFLYIEDDGITPRIGGTSITRTSPVAGNETSTLMTGNLTNVGYTATSKPAWVGTVTFVGNTMTVPVLDNTGLSSREGTITVRATGDEGYVETDIAISQVASVFSASSTAPIVIAYDDLSAKTVTITSSFALAAANVTNSNTTDFSTSIARVGETDNYTLSISAKAANTSGSTHTATVSVTRDALDAISISVTQNDSGSGSSPLADPAHVAITAMSSGGFTAKWDNNTDADGFSWWLSTDEPGDFNETDNIIASGDEGDADLDEGVYTLSVAQALTGKTPYYFYVKAEGSGSWEDSADYGTDVKGYLLFDGSTLTSTATTAATDKTYYTNLTLTFSDGAKCIDVPGTAANAFLKGTGKGIFIGKSGKYINNSKSAIPGDIVKFELYSNKNASMKVSVGVKFGSSALAAYNATGAYTATLSTDDSVYDCSGKLVEHSKYFWFQVTNANNAQLQFLIMYEPE